MRESIRARREWLRLAPHLARPLRFVLPTIGHGLQAGRRSMRAAPGVNDLVSFDRNRGVRRARRLPRGARVERQTGPRRAHRNADTRAATARPPGSMRCASTRSVLLSVVVPTPSRSRASVVELRARDRAPGAPSRDAAACRARDELREREFDIRTRCVINAAGPWVGDWLDMPRLGDRKPPVLRLPGFQSVDPAAAFQGRNRLHGAAASTGQRHTYFVLPWNGRSLMGTRHLQLRSGRALGRGDARGDRRVPRRPQPRAGPQPDRRDGRAGRVSPGCCRRRALTPVREVELRALPQESSTTAGDGAPGLVQRRRGQVDQRPARRGAGRAARACQFGARQRGAGRRPR